MVEQEVTDMQNTVIIYEGTNRHMLRQIAGGALYKLIGNKGGLRLGLSRRCGGLTSSRVDLK